MTKQYKFIFLVGIFLVVLYLVLSFKYEQYQVVKSMEEISESNKGKLEYIADRREIIKYKSSRANKNKRLKEQGNLKGKGEEISYVTSEEEYEKYTAPYTLELTEIEGPIIDSELEGLTNIEKWERFLFGK